jgi:hypothetical protein
VNYYGFSKAFGFGKGKGGILKTIFEWEGNVKPVRFLFLTISFYCLVEKLKATINRYLFEPEVKNKITKK